MASLASLVDPKSPSRRHVPVLLGWYPGLQRAHTGGPPSLPTLNTSQPSRAADVRAGN